MITSIDLHLESFMYVEDVLIAINNKMAFSRTKLFGGLLADAWHRSFIADVASRASAGRILSSNQGRMVLRIIERVRTYLVTYEIASAAAIDTLLTCPQYRRQPYQSTQQVPREARYLGDHLLALRCKADNLLATHIKALAGTVRFRPADRPRFDWTHKIWIVPVHGYNLLPIENLLREHRFLIDERAAAYLALCRRSVEQPSTLVFSDDREALIANVCDNALLAGWITDIAKGIAL